MDEHEESVEERARLLFNRRVAGSPIALGISTGEFREEGRTDFSNTEVMHLTFQTIKATMDAVLLVAREVDELKRAHS